MAYFTKGKACVGGCGRRQGHSPSGFYDAGFNDRGMCPTCVRLGKPEDPFHAARRDAQAAAIAAWKASHPESK